MVKFISIDFENDKEFGFSGPSCEFFFNNKSYKYLFLIEKPSGEDTRGYILVRFSPREGPFQNELVDLCDGDYSFLDWNRILRKLISNEIENV